MHFARVWTRTYGGVSHLTRLISSKKWRATAIGGVAWAVAGGVYDNRPHQPRLPTRAQSRRTQWPMPACCTDPGCSVHTQSTPHKGNTALVPMNPALPLGLFANSVSSLHGPALKPTWRLSELERPGTRSAHEALAAAYVPPHFRCFLDSVAHAQCICVKVMVNVLLFPLHGDHDPEDKSE